MQVKGLSASGFDCYTSCNWKWYLQYILGFEDVSSAAALQGTLIHKVLEILSRAVVVKHDRNSKIFDPSYLWDICFNHYYNSEPYIAELIEPAKLKKICQGFHELLRSPYTPIRDNTISAEAKFDIELREPDFKIKGTNSFLRLRGRIDRVDKIDDKSIEVVDYKSGSRVCWDSQDKHKKTPEDLYEDIQPKMYHLAAKHLYPWAENILVTFIYIVDGGPVTAIFCDDDIKETKNIIKKRFKAIESNEDPQKNVSWRCKNFCYFGDKSGICRNVWDEKEEVGHKFIENKYQTINIRRRIK